MFRIIVVFYLLMPVCSFAQRFDVLQGDLKNLKGISAYNIVFDYKGLIVHGYETEEDYLADKMRIRENKEGGPEKFRKEWFENRSAVYEPRFVDYLNQKFPKGEVKAENNTALAYTMTVKTEWIYPGYLVEPAKITTLITVFETQKPENVLVALRFEKSIGLEKNMYNGLLSERIAGAYEKIAKNMAIQLKRVL